MKVTNNAEAPRGINVLNDKGHPEMLLLQPGETRDVTPVDTKDKVFLGMIKSRDLLVEDSAVEKAVEDAPAAQPAALAMPHSPTKEAIRPDAVPEGKVGKA